MAKIISSNNQPIVDQNHQVAQEQQHDQQQQSSKVLQSTRSQNKINNANEKDTNNKISEQGEDIENCNINDSDGSDKNKSSSSSSNSSDNENNANSEKNPDATNSTTTTTTAGGGNKKLCVVIPPNNKTLLTPTIVTNEPCATPSHLLTSLIQLNGQDVGLFTGLPSCTPTSADSLSTSNLGGINPFFWGVSSFNQDANNNNNGTNETTLNNDFNQRVNKQTTIDSTEMKVVDENVSKQTLQRNHQTPGKLSLDQIQAANAILSPLSLFLSPEGLRFVDANQHPLAGLSGINHELSGHNLSAVQNDINLSNNYHNQTTAAAAAAAAAATCVAAQDLTSNSATENPQQTVNCPISSSASSILQARPTITTVQQYNSQQQQQQAVNQISQSIYSQNQHQLDQTAAIVAPSNTHQLSPRALSQHNQLIYHQQHSIGTTNEEVSVENHLHHIVQQQQQQQQQQQHHVVYAQTQPILSLQCKTLERQPPAFGPPAAHHHHQVQNIHHPQQQPQQHQQAQLNPQQLFAVSEQQAVQRQIEYQHQHQSHQHHHHQQQQQQHIDRARQSSSFPCEQTSQTTIGLYDPQFRNIYLAQQQQQQHNFTGQQGYQSQTISCIQQDHNFGSTATPASQKQPDPPSVDTVRVLGRAKDDLAVAAAPKRTPPLNGKHKQDKVVVSQTVTKTSETPKITNKPPKNESQSKVKRPNKTKVTTIEIAPVAAPTTVTPNGAIDNNGEVLVKKKSKGGRKKKIVTHDELIARKNRSKERNRVAAKRCRLKRKQFLDELCGRIDNLNDLNKKLQKENSLLKGELDILKQHHKTCKV